MAPGRGMTPSMEGHRVRFHKVLILVLVTFAMITGLAGCSGKADHAAGNTAGTKPGTQPGTASGGSSGELPDLLTFEEVGYAGQLAWLDGRRILFSGQSPQEPRRAYSPARSPGGPTARPSRLASGFTKGPVRFPRSSSVRRTQWLFHHQVMLIPRSGRPMAPNWPSSDPPTERWFRT
jgi:hypothetical protein